MKSTAFLWCTKCKAKLIKVSLLNPIEDYCLLNELEIPTKQGWLVKDPLDFENVAFSKPRGLATSSTDHLRYLCCGECDTGPIGYAVLEGPKRIIIVDQNKVA